MELSEIYDDLADLVEEIAKDAIENFQDHIQAYGLVLTDGLKRDFQYHILRTATTLAAEIDFRGYGRFKDMALIRYGAHNAPVDAMEFFVEKIGLDRFAYIHGYKGHQVPTVNNAVKRLAWALAIGRRKVPSIKRGYRGTWYNSGKMEMIKNAQKQLSWRYSELIAPYLARKWEEDRQG
ncbi:hypothetical protein LX87_05174 [Larkinella arboricola]|uniref:Uncharacterized protein n=1 Tax=Larkinella arboricola TaxID=643671 RepID=A0A327WPF5_LARAB|nr:hypothetical protein [Larkinella arboricola]RAJ92206.1 hypothetical protein LX87_05174 [Larkinella arboricola]